MIFKIKIIEISDDLKSKSLNQIMIFILKSKSCPSLVARYYVRPDISFTNIHSF